jgi:hypothetical protein
LGRVLKLFIAAGDEHDDGTAPGKQYAGCPSNSAARAGNKGCLIFQFHVHG